MSLGIFESLAADDSDRRVTHRRAIAVASKRVNDRFGAFLAAANSPTEHTARLDVIRRDVKQVVSSVCNEYGGDPVSIETGILSHLASAKLSWNEPIETGPSPKGPDSANHPMWGIGEGDEAAQAMATEGQYPDQVAQALVEKYDVDPQIAAQIAADADFEYHPDNQQGDRGPSVHDEGLGGYDPNQQEFLAKTASRTSGKTKMCPYHREVTDISLATGDPKAGFNSMSRHAWGQQHCQGGFEGGCNFKPAMVTQQFWDSRAEKAQERRERREQEREIQQQVEETEIPEDASTLEDGFEPEAVDETPAFDEGGINAELADAPSAVGEGAETQTLEPMAASTHTALTAKDFVLIAQAIATSPIEDKQGVAQHFASYLANTNPNFDVERFIAAAGGNPQTGRDNYRGPDPQDLQVAGARIAEALKTIDVEQGGKDQPSPKIDKSQWKPNALYPDGNLPAVPEGIEMDGSPHPTEHVDILEPVAADRGDDFLEGTKAVTENQSVDQNSKFDGEKADSGSWAGNNGTSPVTSAKAQDPEKNPIRQILEEQFVPPIQVQSAIRDYEDQ